MMGRPGGSVYYDFGGYEQRVSAQGAGMNAVKTDVAIDEILQQARVQMGVNDGQVAPVYTVRQGLVDAIESHEAVIKKLKEHLADRSEELLAMPISVLTSLINAAADGAF